MNENHRNPSQTPRPVLRPSDFEHRSVRVDTLSMHVVVAGPDDGPLVLLLHGFSECWYIWRYQIQALGQAGFRVVAPDQRGYNLTDKRGPYDPFTITRDAGDLIRAFGRSRAHIVGHDWGGIIGWLFAAFYPEMVDRLVISNAPHPAAFREVILKPYWPQVRKSLYILFFSLPWIAERSLSAHNYRKLLRYHLDTHAAQKLTEEEIGYYREAWSQPGALAAGLAWYRAMGRHFNDLGFLDTTVRARARMIHGEPDPAFDRVTVEASRSWCPGLEIVYLPNTGHFVPQDAPEEMSQLILEFLTATRNRQEFIV